MSINAPKKGERTFAKYAALAKLVQGPSRVPEGTCSFCHCCVFFVSLE